MIRRGRLALRASRAVHLYRIYMKKYILVLGDILAILTVTIIGFASHGEGGVSFLPRMAAAFFPLLIGWFLLAPA